MTTYLKAGCLAGLAKGSMDKMLFDIGFQAADTFEKDKRKVSLRAKAHANSQLTNRIIRSLRLLGRRYAAPMCSTL